MNPTDTNADGQQTILTVDDDPIFDDQDPSLPVKHDDFINIVRQAMERDLTASGNPAYMHLELMLTRATNEKMQFENLKRSLEQEVIHLQTRLRTIE